MVRLMCCNMYEQVVFTGVVLKLMCEINPLWRNMKCVKIEARTNMNLW